MIWAHGGRAECCLNWNIYTKLALIVNFNKMRVKMNVIVFDCYFERSVVTLTLRKEYLNTVTYNTPVLLWKKY